MCKSFSEFLRVFLHAHGMVLLLGVPDLAAALAIEASPEFRSSAPCELRPGHVSESSKKRA